MIALLGAWGINRRLFQFRVGMARSKNLRNRKKQDEERRKQ